MLPELGNALKGAREAAGSSLFTVAKDARISTAYLQKLERGVVDTPSPHVLRRLASSLHLDYLRLMQLSAYLDSNEAALARERAPEEHPLANARLTSAQWRAVGRYISRLTGKTTREKGS